MALKTFWHRLCQNCVRKRNLKIVKYKKQKLGYFVVKVICSRDVP